MEWVKRLEAIAAAVARINAEGSRKPVERTLVRKRVKTATLQRETARGRERAS
jgi:hypothetical protein